MTARAEVIPILRHRDEKILVLEEKRPSDCEWCKTKVEKHQPTESFRGTEMHRLCAAEAKIAQLEWTVSELLAQRKRDDKRISYLEGATPA